MTPPDQLRHAALLLEQAKLSYDRADVEAKLIEARNICARATHEIDSMLGPSMEQIGRFIHRGGRWF